MIKKDNYTLYLGSMLDVLDALPENSIDAVVTDPPYEINFMGKGWDNSGIAFRVETWKKVLRVLKPGGHLLAFNHSRTFHRMAVAIEDSGFQIRDTIMWMYGSGFPKSHNISIGIDKKLGAERKVVRSYYGVTQNDNSVGGAFNSSEANENGKTMVNVTAPSTDQAKQWDGWGTALKPSYEPIIMARKPLDGTIADNVLKHGVGGINIDECRVGTEERTQFSGKGTNGEVYYRFPQDNAHWETVNGRFPANTIHDGGEEVTDLFPSVDGSKGSGLTNTPARATFNQSIDGINRVGYDDTGSASRFFYTAKTSKKDRDEGLDGFDYQISSDRNKIEGVGANNPRNRTGTPKKNIHPTVKPTNLMQYLIRLVTPKGGKVLDPFMGSGSTGKAAMIENNERNAGYHFIGIDLSQEYIDIAESRIEYGINYRENKAVEEERQTLGDNQIRLKL